jgi:steroid 5-alpha reductase family enzyme
MFFALIIVAITLTAFALAPAYNTLQWVLLAMVLLWALRITAHLIGRNWGHGEDPRYTKLRSWVNNERAFLWLSLRQVFLLQAVVLWLASLPVQVGLFAGTRQIGLLAMLGSLLWLLGLIVETVADAQLRRFRAQPENRGTVLCTGLWRYSRHPNYFGELCVWWGIWLVACEVPLGWLTVVGPLAYSYLVVNVTGQKTLDKKLAREKPGYAEYMARTSGLIPLPPKRPA